MYESWDIKYFISTLLPTVINSESLSTTTAEKDLAVSLNQNLKFHQQIAAVKAKANCDNTSMLILCHY